MIALEAMLGGAGDVRVHVAEGWIGIYSDVDWLAELEADAFNGFIPFKPGGQNSVTSEFLPVVFSRSVATAVSGEARIVKGDSLGPLIMTSNDWIRAVAFEVVSDVEIGE